MPLRLLWLHAIVLISLSALKISDGRFSTKTSYVSALNLSRDSSSNHLRSAVYPDFCHPVHLTLLLRHGTRNPSLGDVEKIEHLINLLEESPSLLPRYKTLITSKNPFAAAGDKQLTLTGVEENVLISESYLDKFAELFDSEQVLDGEIEIFSSAIQRTEESARAFCYSLAERLKIPNPCTGIIYRNDVLRFFDSCDLYQTTVKDNANTSVEHEFFRSGTLMALSAASLCSRTGIDCAKISPGHVRAIWSACGLMAAIYREDSLWCDMLEDEDYHLQEYAKDLMEYWRKFAGYEINYKPMCPMLDEMLTSLEAAADGNSNKKASFYFGHAETVLPFYALLGLHKDPVPLRASNYQEHKHKRKFRTSKIAPFGANIGLMLYECDQSQTCDGDGATGEKDEGCTAWPKSVSKHMVQVINNGEPLAFPFSDHIASPLQDVREFYNTHHLNSCDFNQLCDLESKGKKEEL